MNTNSHLKECITSNIEHLKSLDAHAYYEYLRNNIDEIQKRYAKGAMNIVDGVTTEEPVNKIEILPLIDENDEFYRNKDGFWASEFRQDYVNYETLPESRERKIFCRVTLAIIEDMNGNIVVSRRSPNKSHPNMLEIPGGHVSVGYEYIETAKKEFLEEFSNDNNKEQKNDLERLLQPLSESDRLFKFRKLVPKIEPETKGKGTIVSVYLVRIPFAEILNPNIEEIAELITMTPEELLACIQKNEEGNAFDANHACMYLEYLKTRLPDRIEEIIETQKKLGHTLTKIDTFSKSEKLG